jgi:hypothetical protein
VSGQLRAPAALLPGNSHRHSLYRSLGGPQSWYGHCGEVNKLLTLPEIEPQFLWRLAVSLAAVRSELPRYYRRLQKDSVDSITFNFVKQIYFTRCLICTVSLNEDMLRDSWKKTFAMSGVNSTSSSQPHLSLRYCELLSEPYRFATSHHIITEFWYTLHNILLDVCRKCPYHLL